MFVSTTFNNISVILWRSALLVEGTEYPENHRHVASHWQTLSHNVVQVHLAWAGFELTISVVIDTDKIQLSYDVEQLKHPSFLPNAQFQSQKRNSTINHLVLSYF